MRKRHNVLLARVVITFLITVKGTQLVPLICVTVKFTMADVNAKIELYFLHSFLTKT